MNTWIPWLLPIKRRCQNDDLLFEQYIAQYRLYLYLIEIGRLQQYVDANYTFLLKGDF
jgi:hypothetical protein